MNKKFCKIGLIFSLIILFAGVEIVPSLSVSKDTEQRIEFIGEQDTIGVITQDEHDAQSNWVSIESENNQETSIHGLMRVDGETLQQWQEEHEHQEIAYIDQSLKNSIALTDDYSILDLLNYDPRERNQGWCGNCWMWPCTAIAEIALNVQEGIYDRLSVQYLNSCGSVVGVGCCEGGNTWDFSRFYSNKDHFIPWSNTNAHWQDNRGQCNTDCSSISTTPNYPISSIRSKTIKIHDISEEEAIENIKNVLHQRKGVYFSFFGNDNFFTHFNNFWKTKSEDDVYNLDWNNGSEYGGNGAGHAVLIVGYHDENGSTNDYWVMLNSWGTASKRPNGLFRVNMHMDYDCIITDEGREYDAFGCKTFNITFGSESEAPNPPIIVGYANGSARNAYFYDFTADDPQNDDIYFFIDWGDGQTEEWIGPYESGETYEASHSWKRGGIYEIRAKAKDDDGNEGAWATFEVTMPKNKQLSDPFINFTGYYPYLFPMLRQLLQL